MPWHIGKNDEECFWAVNVHDGDPLSSADPAGEPWQFPGQLLHPYIYITKAIEWLHANPERIHAPDPTRTPAQRASVVRKRVRMDWTTRRVGAMATADILAALGAVGIPLDEDGFRSLAVQHRSAIDIAEERIASPGDIPAPYDDDFVWMAMLELWRRLMPERPCVEMVEEPLVDGYLAMDGDDLTGAIAHWERAWEIIVMAVPASITSIEEAETFLTGRPPTQLQGWCDEFCGALIDATWDDRSFAGRLLAYSLGFMARFPGSYAGAVLLMRTAVAESHAMLGHREEADAAYGALVRDDPNDVPTYLLWADSLWRPPAVRRMDVRARDRARAEALYRKALAIGGPLEYVLRDRLEELRQYEDRAYS